jgi:hypothetical protein
LVLQLEDVHQAIVTLEVGALLVHQMVKTVDVETHEGLQSPLVLTAEHLPLPKVGLRLALTVCWFWFFLCFEFLFLIFVVELEPHGADNAAATASEGMVDEAVLLNE